MAKKNENSKSSIANLERQLKALQGRNKHTYLIPVSILFAGLFIAVAVIFSSQKRDTLNAQVLKDASKAPRAPAIARESNIPLDEITDQDHIRGSIDAPVKVIEFSDFECPFCKRLHPTLQKVMKEYGSNNQVAWIYKHFPLDSLHPVKARKEAVASECASDQGGNDAFWDYTDALFQNVLSNNRTDMSLLPKLAKSVGLDVEKFNTCLESGKFDALVQDQIDQAIAAGGRGTPYSVVVSPSGKTYPLSGALPYSSFQAVIDLALKDK